MAMPRMRSSTPPPAPPTRSRTPGSAASPPVSRAPRDLGGGPPRGEPSPCGRPSGCDRRRRRGFMVDQGSSARPPTTSPGSPRSAPQGALPRRGPTARGGVDLPQPRAGRDVRAGRPARDRRPLPGRLTEEIVRTVQDPPVGATPPLPWPFPIRPGQLDSDLAAYDAAPPPHPIWYRAARRLRMPTPSTGGSTVGEALNIIEPGPSPTRPDPTLHRYLEASALAFADRNRYVGENPAPPPLDALLIRRFAPERACLIDPAPRSPSRSHRGTRTATTRCPTAPTARAPTTVHHEPHGADRWGNVSRTRSPSSSRWQRHRRAGSGVPAQQRADRLQFHRDPGQRARPQPAGSRQAAPQLHGPDDRPRARPSVWPPVRPAARPSSPPSYRSSSTASSSA